MTVYLVLLRGINVGGKNKIKMAELRAALEAIGLKRVQTYIQSGNIVCESGETGNAVRAMTERQIEAVFGISLTAVVRTAQEWEELISRCPYPADSLPEGEGVHVSLLNEPPAADASGLLSRGKSDHDEFRIIGREIYLLLRKGMRDAKLADNLQKLGSSVTTRNWNTMKKLAELARARSLETSGEC